MCGFVGYVGKTKDNEKVLKNMTNKKRRYIQFILNYQRYNKNNITYTKNLLKNNSIFVCII